MLRVELLQSPVTRREALSKLMECTLEQLHEQFHDLLDAITDSDTFDIEVQSALLHLANHGYGLRDIFLHEGVGVMINRLFANANGFSLHMMARLLGNKENQQEALRRFPRLIESMFRAKKHFRKIVDIVVLLTQCDSDMFPADTGFDFTAQRLRENEINLVSALAKLPEARSLIMDFEGLMQALVRNRRRRPEYKLKALDVLASLFEDKQLCVKFAEKHRDVFRYLFQHGRKPECIPILHTCCINNEASAIQEMIYDCVRELSRVEKPEFLDAWLEFFRGPKGDFPIPMTLTTFQHVLGQGPKQLARGFPKITREEFVTDYQLLPLGGEVRQQALRRLCQRVVVWSFNCPSQAWEFSTVEDVQLLFQSWEVNKSANMSEEEWHSELCVMMYLSRAAEAAIPMSNVPGMMELLLDHESDNENLLEQKYAILTNFANNADFIASRACLEAVPRMVHALIGGNNVGLQMVFEYIKQVYITPKKYHEAYLCPGLVDRMLDYMQQEVDYVTPVFQGGRFSHAVQVLDKLSSLPDISRDMLTRAGFVDTLVDVCSKCETIDGVIYDQDEDSDDDSDWDEYSIANKEGSQLRRILMRVGGIIEPNHDYNATLEELNETLAFWRSVLAIWTLRTPRFAKRLHGSAVTKKLPTELARMVFEMLI